MTKLIRKIPEKIIIQSLRNTLQQGYVNILLAENLVNMRASATNVFGQLGSRYTFLPHYLFYMLPNVHNL